MDKISKRVKVLIGLLTIWPMIWMVIFFVSMFGIGLLTFLHSGHGRGDPFDGLRFFAMVPHMFTILLMNLLLVFYIVHVTITTRIPENKTKALWAALLYLFNILAMIVYWFMYIWREPKVVAGQAAQTSG